MVNPPQYANPRQTSWFYLVGKCEGKTVLIGPEATKELANQKGFQLFDGVFEIYELSTKDRARATQMLKAKLADQTGNLSEALHPVKHYVNQ